MCRRATHRARIVATAAGQAPRSVPLSKRGQWELSLPAAGGHKPLGGPTFGIVLNALNLYRQRELDFVAACARANIPCDLSKGSCRHTVASPDKVEGMP